MLMVEWDSLCCCLSWSYYASWLAKQDHYLRIDWRRGVSNSFFALLSRGLTRNLQQGLLLLQQLLSPHSLLHPFERDFLKIDCHDFRLRKQQLLGLPLFSQCDQEWLVWKSPLVKAAGSDCGSTAIVCCLPSRLRAESLFAKAASLPYSIAAATRLQQFACGLCVAVSAARRPTPIPPPQSNSALPLACWYAQITRLRGLWSTVRQ